MKLKETMMIAIGALAFLLITGIAKADDKSITTKELANNISELPSKVVTFIGNEKQKTIDYQTKVWADQKVKNAEMWSKLKSLFKGNNDS